MVGSSGPDNIPQEELKKVADVYGILQVQSALEAEQARVQREAEERAALVLQSRVRWPISTCQVG